MEYSNNSKGHLVIICHLKEEEKEEDVAEEEEE